MSNLNNPNNIVDLLTKYNLKETEARIYVFLLKKSLPLTVVELARALSLGRTPVYAALDRLEAKGLVTKTLADNGAAFLASPPDNLEKYWHSEIRKKERLASNLPAITNLLESLNSTTGYKSEVNYFSGRRGLEQITYNSLKAIDDLYIYEIASTMDNFIDTKTAEEFRVVWAEKKTKLHQLTNNTEMEDFTDVPEILPLWDIRHIPEETLKIEFEMLIYNNTVALYSPVGKEIFGVEIKNKNLASLQKQIFQVVAATATPMEITSPRGAVRLPSHN
jgi:sugar-specific transcriptional regulator TrmB